jgi:hypothetical protein
MKQTQPTTSKYSLGLQLDDAPEPIQKRSQGQSAFRSKLKRSSRRERRRRHWRDNQRASK